jgi:integrase
VDLTPTLAGLVGVQVRDDHDGHARRLKNRTSHRAVRLWPQLETILEEYLDSVRGTAPGLLFPSEQTGEMITDFRKPLDTVGERAGWERGRIRTKIFRHTFCATRLQTLDRGYPVAEFTVGKELGHGGPSLVRRIYGHLGEIPHRSEYVEYRIEQQPEIPPERLELVGVVPRFRLDTVPGTVAFGGVEQNEKPDRKTRSGFTYEG